MTRIDEFRQAASDKYKDSDFRVPDMYCFIEGAQWADANPRKWIKFTDRPPQKGDLIALAVINDDSQPASYSIIENMTRLKYTSRMKRWFGIHYPDLDVYRLFPVIRRRSYR